MQKDGCDIGFKDNHRILGQTAEISYFNTGPCRGQFTDKTFQKRVSIIP
jgi:hypothetical protein